MSNDKQERIVCAAIKVSLVKDGYQGINIVTGVDYKSIVEGGLISEISHPTYCNIFIRGFITNKNRFVDPKEAMGIAVKAGQANGIYLIDGFQRGLKPEDLY